MDKVKIIAGNKNLYRNYFVMETIEAGIILTGTEIKSIRSGKVSIEDAYCDIKDSRIYVVGMHIAPYFKGNIFNHKEKRDRELLLHKKEIIKLAYLQSLKHLTLVPAELYIVKGLAKLKIALVKGKKLYDKRQDIKERDLNREIRKR